MKNIGIFSYGRKGSQRCPNKMLRPFAGTTVVDILLRKLKLLGENSFFAGYDEEFKNKAAAAGVRFVQRTKKSVSIDGPQVECLSFLREVGYEYLLLVNGCLTFLQVNTIKKFLTDV